LKRRASAQTSAQTSDVEKQKRHRDELDEEVGDKEETKEKSNLANKSDARILIETTPGTITNIRMEF
jgi:hypothetical protein